MNTRYDIDRSIAEWLRAQVPDRAPERLLAASRERIRTTPQRRSAPLSWPTMSRTVRFGLAATAVLIAAVVGIRLTGGIPPGGSPPIPSPSPSLASTPVPTPTPAPTPTPGGSGFVMDALKNETRLLAPYREGWEQRLNMLTRGDVIGISAWSVDGVFADPCRWETTLVRPEFDGSWFDTFVGTLMQQPGRDASLSEPDIDFGGWPSIAAMVELSVPVDLDVARCDQGMYNAWQDTRAEALIRWNSNHEPGQSDIVYAVNIDRGPVIIHAWLRAGATAEDRAELKAMLSEIRLELAPTP